MATNKPRIAITLRPHVHEVIKRLAELNGQPMSKIVAELIDAVSEPLIRTVALLEAASAAPKQVKDGLRQTAENIERELYGAAGYSLAQMDWMIEELGSKTDAHGGRRKPAPGAADLPSVAKKKARPKARSNPHIVIRGSGLGDSKEIKDLGKPKKGAKRG